MAQGASKWQLAGAYLGSVIGAGFASGREHLQFFLSFGAYGYWGLLIAGALFAIFGSAFMSLAHQHRTKSHSDLLRAVATPSIARLFDIILCCIMLTSVSVMMAGGGALFERAGIGSHLTGALAMGGGAALIVASGFVRMLNVNGFVTAVLIAFIGWIGVRSALTSASALSIEAALEGVSWVPGTWYASAALYGAYNLTYGFALFGALGSGMRSRSDARVGGFVGGLALAVLSLFVCLAVQSALPDAAGSEIPMLASVVRLGDFPPELYVVALWLAMLTTAIAGIYSLACRVRDWSRLPFGLVPFVVLAVAFPASLFGFRFLIATVYPISGYVGVGCLVAVLIVRQAKMRVA